jgi:hypothetical protein
MRDYSLHAFPNRLAVDGEDLVVHRFLGASMGLASPADLQMANLPAVSGKKPIWHRLANWLQGLKLKLELQKRTCAVCVPPGARLILRDIPKGLQRELNISEVEAVTFVETTAEENSYRDAVRFGNRRELLLHMLEEGQRVIVLSVTPVGMNVFEERRWLDVPATRSA